MDVRSWPLWRLPRTGVALVLTVALAAPAAVALLGPVAPTRRELLVLAGCAASPPIVLAAALRVGEIKHRGARVGQEQLDLWLVAAFVAAPGPLAALVTAPGWLLRWLSRGWGRLLGTELVRPLHGHQAVFNTASTVLGACAAQAVFVALGGTAALVPAGLAAVAALAGVQVLLVTTAVALSTGERDPRALWRVLVVGSRGDLALGCAGLLLGVAATVTLWTPVLQALSGTDLDAALALADTALYAAKRGGRDRVVEAGGAGTVPAPRSGADEVVRPG